MQEQSTHKCAQHLRTIHHLSREALPIEPSLISLGGAFLRRWGEMKGQEVSIRLRGHSDEQAQTAGALLCSASTWKNGKGESDGMHEHANASEVKAISVSIFRWCLKFPNLQTFDTQMLKSLKIYCCTELWQQACSKALKVERLIKTEPMSGEHFKPANYDSSRHKNTKMYIYMYKYICIV